MVKRDRLVVCMADIVVVVAIVLFSSISIVTIVNIATLLLRELEKPRDPIGYVPLN
jgi:hypothetical protein